MEKIQYMTYGTCIPNIDLGNSVRAFLTSTFMTGQLTHSGTDLKQYIRINPLIGQRLLLGMNNVNTPYIN